MDSAPDVIVLASANETWPEAVERLLAGKLTCVVVDSSQALPAGLNGKQVRVVVASPSDAARHVGSFPNVKWIQSTWAGVDALRDHIPPDAVVTPLKHVFGQAMSEYVLGWILALERQVLIRAQDRQWNTTPESGVLGKTMGILGTGSIGTAIALSARHLGMHCRGMNMTGKPVAGFDQCYASRDSAFFDGLDYAVAVLPKTPQTDHVLNASAFSVMSPGGIVINIGRGNAVDNTALLQALDQQALRAAVLDVFDEEPLPPQHPFWRHSGVYVTSHTAAPTAENQVASAMADNLRRYLNGDALLDVYQPDKGY